MLIFANDIYAKQGVEQKIENNNSQAQENNLMRFQIFDRLIQEWKFKVSGGTSFFVFLCFCKTIVY